jgi:S1-C subfamily serine protease
VDSPIVIPRAVASSLAVLRCEIPSDHPSAAILGEERFGVAVAVAPGRLLTAHYLVLGATTVSVTGIDGTAGRVTRCALDHDTGLAVLHVEADGLDPVELKPVPPRPGAAVFLLSCTTDGEVKGATGHVSTVGPFEAFWEYMLDDAIMTTIVNPGLAGAGLFDDQGRLAGIVSLGLAAVGRYSLAVPVSLYTEHRDEFERAERSSLRQRRAWLGFFPQGHQGSVVVTGVLPGSPAERAGLERGDLILSLDGEPVGSLRDLYKALWRHTPGEPLGLQVLRESSIRLVDVVAGDRDEFYK